MQRVAGRAGVVGGRDGGGGQAGGQGEGERGRCEGVRVGGSQAGRGGRQAQQRQVEAQEHAQVELAAVGRALHSGGIPDVRTKSYSFVVNNFPCLHSLWAHIM